SDPSMLATDLADELVRRGVPFRWAHDQVGRLASEAERLGTTLDAVPEAVRKSCVPEIPEEEFQKIFDVGRALAARRASGAPSPEGVRQRLDDWLARLAGEAG
ncbi:MAG: hypothetical protein N2322_08265, partial [Terrimicrobiaceae bacterium]|nr:hypothetical protein [Terrimicrobiaceae bacterium]